MLLQTHDFETDMKETTMDDQKQQQFSYMCVMHAKLSLWTFSHWALFLYCQAVRTGFHVVRSINFHSHTQRQERGFQKEKKAYFQVHTQACCICTCNMAVLNNLYVFRAPITRWNVYIPQRWDQTALQSHLLHSPECTANFCVIIRIWPCIK